MEEDYDELMWKLWEVEKKTQNKNNRNWVSETPKDPTMDMDTLSMDFLIRQTLKTTLYKIIIWQTEEIKRWKEC